MKEKQYLMKFTEPFSYLSFRRFLILVVIELEWKIHLTSLLCAFSGKLDGDWDCKLSLH